MEDKWTLVAEHDVTFAKRLADEGKTFGPEFKSRVIEGRVAGCRPRASKLAGLPQQDVRQIELYCEHHCLPWSNTWSEVLRPCDGDRFVPDWCKAGHTELAADHIKLGPYFETLTTALSATESRLVAYNLMAVIADRLDTNVVRDYRREDIERWVEASASAFLEHAKPDEAIDVGWLLYATPFENSQKVASSFRGYVRRAPNMTVEQRRFLQEVARGLEEGNVSSEVQETLQARLGPKPSPSPTPVSPRTNAKDMALLMGRVDGYYRLIRDRKYGESWDMVALDYREGGYDKDSYIRTEKAIEEQSDLEDWRVKGIRVKGDIAKVFMVVTQKERKGLLKSQERESTHEDFWTFENGTWYNMVKWPADWEDQDAVAVPAPREAMSNHD